MGNLLSGLSDLGLGDLEGAKLYEDPNKNQDSNKGKKAAEIEEKDLIYDRNYDCPVCGEKITAKTMKAGKARLIRTDNDLRSVFEGIDAYKYDVICCPKCGYSALIRFFKPMPEGQVRLIREKICQHIKLKPHTGDTYTYEEAMEHYKVALACSIVKQARNSEKAYTCLKAAWVLRGWRETLEREPDTEEKRAELKAQEKEYLKNAMEGFIAAEAAESFPICGMDDTTLEYLIANLAFELGKYDIASKLISEILIRPYANSRMKDKTRELKDAVLAELRKNKV